MEPGSLFIFLVGEGAAMTAPMTAKTRVKEEKFISDSLVID